MASGITKDDRELFEQYLEEHPPVEREDPDLIDDDRMNFDHEASMARIIKALLDGKLD